MPSRRLLLKTSGIAPVSTSLVIAAPWLILPRKSLAQSAPSDVAGTVQRTEGFVRLVGANERNAAAGTIIREGDRMITTPNSDAIVKLNDGAVIAVRANSEMLFAQQRFNARDPSDSSSVMELVRGALRQVTGLIAKTQPANVRVQTNTATIGVRGTDFETVQIDQQSVAMGTSLQPGNYTQVYSGRTVVEGRGSGGSERVEVGAGQTSFSPDRSFGASTPFGLMRSVPSGVFRGGRFDGQLGGVQRQMMQEINNSMRESLPPELQRIMPEFGVTPRR
jgi:FecR protein